MRKKKKSPQHELESNTGYKGLDKEERDYIEKFNSEWYYGSRYGEYEINQTPEHQKECNRNNNRNNRDMMSVGERMGTLIELSEDEKDFMEQASDEWQWQDVYKVQGKEAAVELIFEQAKRDLTNKILDVNIILSRFASKLFNLKTLDERRRKQGKK